MTAHLRTFEDRPAVRAHVPLLIGIVGPSNSGKTYSALRLATGIQRISGGEIFVIDTESGRAKHYAPEAGKEPGPSEFKFRHVAFEAPFGSLDYLASLRHCHARGAGVTIVDSMTHEHIGQGGYLLTQEAEMERMAGEDQAKRERVKMAGWIKPAKLRQEFIVGLLQLNSNFIFCFRAKEKIKPVVGKQPLEMGFMPIAGEELLFEMTVNCLLMPKSGGVPAWRSDHIGEKLMMKCPRHFEQLFEPQKPLDEGIGQALAEWARGGEERPTGPTPTIPEVDYSAAGNAAAEGGTNALSAFWAALSAPEHQKIGRSQLESWRRTAAEADAEKQAKELGYGVS